MLSGGKRESRGHAARGVKLEKLLRHVAHFAFDAGPGAVPRCPAHLVEDGFGFAFAAKPLHQIHARERHVELVAARVFEQHVIAFGVALSDFANAEELADAVFQMNHVIAGLEIELIGGESREVRLARFRGRLRRFEQVFGAEDREAPFLKHRAARHISADQRDARAERLRALLQIFGNLLALQIDLIGHRIFGKHIGEPLHFA